MERRLELIADMSVAIWVHLICVAVALAIGGYVLARRKGDRLHRILGRVWVALMFVGALSSFLIREINDGGFSPIHVLSAYTLFSISMGVWAIRRTPKRVKAHRASMQSLYATGLLIAGGFTFLPERLLGRLTFGEIMPIANTVIIVPMVILGLVLWWRSYRAE